MEIERFRYQIRKPVLKTVWPLGVISSDVEKVIKQLQAGETPEKEVYMTEHWYVNEDVLSSITVNGEEQALTVVTQEIIDAQY